MELGGADGSGELSVALRTGQQLQKAASLRTHSERGRSYMSREVPLGHFNVSARITCKVCLEPVLPPPLSPTK